MFTRHTKDEARDQIAELIRIFRNGIRHYKSEEYLEENVKKEFIDRMLIALNWDVNNENGVSPKYKEVVFEARANERGVTRHPDYALCIGGNPVFYLEAKAPSVKVLDADEYALQLRTYAYSMKKPVSILTDFEEFAVYDARTKPKETDTADTSRIKYITFDHYLDEFDYLWDTFSYDSVIHGSIDTYFDRSDGNYSQNDINDEMLEALDQWRNMFIMAIRNGIEIDEDKVNTAVQRLVNRFVYIWRKKGY